MNANGNHTLDNIVDQAELSDLQKKDKDMACEWGSVFVVRDREWFCDDGYCDLAILFFQQLVWCVVKRW